MSSSEYNQLLKFLYFEGYADSYEEAEYILEEMSDEEFEDLIEAKDIPQEVALKLADMLKGAPPISARGGIARGLRQYAIERNKKRLAKLQQNEEIEELDERKLAHSFPLKPSERLAVERIRARLDGEEQERQTRSARRVEPEPTVVSKRKPTIKRTDLSSIVKEDFDTIVEFLFVEGYADTIENAELMAENISEEWVDEILDEKHVKAMDTTGRGADRRASDLGGVPQRRKPTPDKYKHSEGDFSPRDLSPGARRRRDERRQGVGGFNEAKADPQDAVQRLRARNMRLQQDHPEVPSGRDQTEYRHEKHKKARGVKTKGR